MKHLAIMSRASAEAVLTGIKTIETRFSRHKIAPFGQVSSGDLVYIKIPGKDIVGQFKVVKVISIDGLETGDLEKIYKDYGEFINSGDQKVDTDYQNLKTASRFGTLIFIKESERLITSPIRLKKKDLRGWVVLDK